MPSTSLCLNTLNSTHHSNLHSSHTHTVHIPGPCHFIKQILSFIPISSNCISYETLWSSWLMGAIFYSELFQHRPIQLAYMMLMHTVIFLLISVSCTGQLVGHREYQPNTKIKRRWVLNTVIPGMANNVKKTLTTGGDKQKIHVDDQALLFLRMIFSFKWFILPGRDSIISEYMALREHLENVCWINKFATVTLKCPTFTNLHNSIIQVQYTANLNSLCQCNIKPQV